eukprot:CAMPEP_0116141082 /NCGR_PEP_ID=MMETSP0329-20121206/14193_1 /TAXON_ID=697910 /ORGANISM="Pseudo-nitzschia arenysensis, Strain B593" /LENGTH=557 /DNA_ID=CAMNT_0003636243 /DNA_START=195 /DNA_END=1868 /DNA_ORIENTATION=-
MGGEMDLVQANKLSPLMRSIMRIRGGEEEEEDEAEEEEEEEEDDDEEGEEDAPVAGIDYNAIIQKALDVTKEIVEVTKVKVFPVLSKYSVKGAVTAKKTSITVYKAIRRAISAAFEKEESDDEDSDDEDDEEEDEAATAMDKVIALSKKTVAAVKRMVKAAMTVPEEEIETEEDEDDEEEEETPEDFEGEKEDEATKKSETIEPEETSDEPATDFGSYLSEAWGIADERDSGKKKGVTILGGSLQDALLAAKQEARMLLVFIPSEKPDSERGGLSFFGGNKGNAESEENDKVAIESLLSAEVSKAANKKARKKGDGSGSFAIWVAKAGSPEATAAIKQLKLKETSAKGKKRAIMSVVYPAFSSGKIAPQVLAQHHCNPPMKAESMSSWMNALRKRHGKQYVTMQTDLKEMKLYQERKEGYIDSVESDNERKAKEAKEEAERKAQEVKEAARQAEIDARRMELQQSLPEDLKKGSNVKKIALRFADGRSGQRGFASDQPLSVVFDWVDAMFEIERETVVLTTLNGKQTFSWDDDGTKNGKTLEDAGLNKMTAFRVTAA